MRDEVPMDMAFFATGILPQMERLAMMAMHERAR